MMALAFLMTDFCCYVFSWVVNLNGSGLVLDDDHVYCLEASEDHCACCC